VTGLAPDQPTYRLLVVDDKEVNRDLLVRLLAPLGFEVQEAANGQEALDVWQRWRPHLIWMDMRMPVMDGYEATRRIKATTQGQGTVIIAITASALEEDRAVILSEGCDDYLRKPFREEEIFQALTKHLGVRFVLAPVEPPAEHTPAAPEAARPLPSQKLAQAELVARLRGLPPAWRAALRQATLLGSMDAVQARLREIRDQQPDLAEALAALATDYAHDRILKLLREVEGGP
jgi:CheY-like chemotaxis protein